MPHQRQANPPQNDLAFSQSTPLCRSYALEIGATTPHKEHDMPKGEQRSNKMVKKPKKDTSPTKESTSPSTRPVAPMTSVIPKGKLKDK